MSHAYHESLEGYHPDQVLVDHCPECEARGANVEVALAHFDAQRLRWAWLRAADWQASSPPSGKRAIHISNAEVGVLRFFWALQVRFEPVWPLGTLPAGVR
jgi:hypothetical protein